MTLTDQKKKMRGQKMKTFSARRSIQHIMKKTTIDQKTVNGHLRNP